MKTQIDSPSYGGVRYIFILGFVMAMLSCQPLFELPNESGLLSDLSGDGGYRPDPSVGLTIRNISPSSGPVTGNQPIEIAGTGFGPGATVRFGSIVASPVEVVSTEQLRVTLPAHLDGLSLGEKPFGQLLVTVKQGQLTTTGSFTYSAAPLSWSAAQELPGQGKTYQNPVLVQIHNNVDGHGQPGVLVAKDSGSLVGVSWRWNDGTFDSETYFTSNGTPGSILGFNFDNNDPVPDVFVGNQNGLFRLIHDDPGKHSFKSNPKIISLQIGGPISVVAHKSQNYMIAIDNDPANYHANILVPGLGGNLILDPSKKIPLTIACPGIVAAKFTGNPWDDLALIEQDGGTTGHVRILLGTNAPGIFQPMRVSYPVGRNPRSIVAADINLDGWLDIAVAAKDDAVISILLGNGSGTFAPALNISTVIDAPVALRAADLNRDGFPDLAFVSEKKDGLFVLLNQGTDGFVLSPFTFPGTEGDHRDLDLGDVDGDNLPDVVLPNYTQNKIQLVLNRSH